MIAIINAIARGVDSMWIYNSTDYLCHHGTKGMRWGVRRYQNKDGSRTDLGKNRETKREKRAAVLNKATTASIKGGKDKPPISPAEKIAKEAGNITTKTSDVIDNTARMRSRSKQKQSEINKMTDKELRDKVDRMRLENQYTDLSSERVSRGSAYAKDILGIVGGVVGIAASSVAIISTVKTLKG